MRTGDFILFWTVITLALCLVIGVPAFLLIYLGFGMPLAFSLYFSFGACLFGSVMTMLTTKL